MQHSQSEADHLQVFASGGCGNVSRPRSHVVYDCLLKPRHEKVRPFVDDIFLDSGQPVEDDGSSSAFYIVQ